MASTDEAVAVLGIGAMGHGMAMSAFRAAFRRSSGTIRNPEATRDIAALDTNVADSAADAARRAMVVVTMVTDTNAVV